MATALVTGASAGLGREFARQLAERGHDVVLVARDRARLEDVSDELRRAYGVQTEILTADLGDREQLQRVADRLADPDRPVSLLVNNAGYGMRRRFLDTALKDEERHLDVLVRAVLVLSHAAGRAMRSRGHGAIVNVASVASFLATGSYSAAKAWVRVFSESLAADLTGTGVTVTACCPGFVHTEFHDRMGTSMAGTPGFLWLDAPKVVAECLDDVGRGRVVSVPGAQYKAMVGALKLVPRGLIRRRARLVHRPSTPTATATPTPTSTATPTATPATPDAPRPPER